MTNREKYGEQILDYIEDGHRCFGVFGSTPKPCEGSRCIECGFFDNKKPCYEEFAEWLKEEYQEPQVDWTKVAVDTPILVRRENDDEWYRRYFAKYDNGKVYTFSAGLTSWSTDDPQCIVTWKVAKLWKGGMEE